mgnify:CR=1 FL=1
MSMTCKRQQQRRRSGRAGSAGAVRAVSEARGGRQAGYPGRHPNTGGHPQEAAQEEQPTPATGEYVSPLTNLIKSIVLIILIKNKLVI